MLIVAHFSDYFYTISGSSVQGNTDEMVFLLVTKGLYSTGKKGLATLQINGFVVLTFFTSKFSIR